MEKETRNAIGKNIARLRKIRGLSQKELAEKSKCIVQLETELKK